MITLDPRDTDHVLTHTSDLWESLRGETIFVTGGTGFFGCWLLESFVTANRNHGLDAKMVVLSRDPARFAQKAPALAQCAEIQWVKGSILNLSATQMAQQLGEATVRRIRWMVHLVTEADLTSTAQQPVNALAAIVDTTRIALELARTIGVLRFLFTSSGAVYGPQPTEMEQISEDSLLGPDYLNPSAPYGLAGEAKRSAEAFCAAYGQQYGFASVIARGFSFIGPYLPLDSKFAIGNFIRDALDGKSIAIKGDGTPIRSYLYGADLAIWLWTLLVKGKGGRAYNLGSEKPYSIREAAEQVCQVAGKSATVEIMQQPKPGAAPVRYVPSTTRAQQELGLKERIDLHDAVERTLRWYKRPRHINQTGG